MSKSKNIGTCLLCKEKVDHRSTIKHIEQCLEKNEWASVKNNNPLEKEKIFLIKVFAGKEFWLYIEINGKDYSSDGQLRKSIDKVLDVGTQFDYEYDNCDGEEFMLPVVNSPRMGMCGYSGPDT